MNDNWILTLNDQIVNLSNFENFWIEDTKTYRVFGCDKRQIEWIFAEFDNKERAQEYLLLIYSHINKKEFNEPFKSQYDED